MAARKKVVKKKTTVRKAASPVVVNVGHFDSKLEQVEVEPGQTVKNAFEEAGINLSEYEDVEINTLNAAVVKPTDKVKSGTSYLLTGNYDNGGY